MVLRVQESNESVGRVVVAYIDTLRVGIILKSKEQLLVVQGVGNQQLMKAIE